MRLPRDAIEEFREIWKRYTGEEIDYKDAEAQSKKLITVLSASLNMNSNKYEK